MRSKFLRLGALAGLVAGLVAVPPAFQASASTLVDLSVQDPPAAATPSPAVAPGKGVLNTVTAKNASAVSVPADLTITNSGGGTYQASSSTIPSGCSAPADGTTDPTIICHFTLLAPSQAIPVKVAIHAPASGTLTDAATIAVPPTAIGFIDNNSSNNSTSVSTTVDPNAAAGLLRTGETLGFNQAGQNDVVTNVDSADIVISLGVAPANGDQCGTSACADGLEVTPDPNHVGLYQADVSFGKGIACRSVVDPPNCPPIFFRHPGNPPFAAATCPTSTSFDCEVSRYKLPGAQVHYVVRGHGTGILPIKV